MKKIVVIIILGIFFLNTARAAKPDSLIVYLKNSEKVVKSRDSADFIRFIFPPDTTIDKDLYRVYDYYMDGKRKSVATSLTGTANIVFEGYRINYFRNGHRKNEIKYKNGYITGVITYYYPSGNLYQLLKVEDNNIDNNYYRGYSNFFYNYRFSIIEFRDSTGKILAANGTGHSIIYDDDFKMVVAEGDVKNGKLDGEWKGPVKDTGRFTCIFHRGDLKSGICYTNKGQQYVFKQFRTRAVFDDGKDEFGLFIKRNLQFPETEKRKVAGFVTVGFYVETNGTISDVKVVRSLIRSLDEEALRVVKQSPLWNPATSFGIPTREYHTVYVYF